MARIDCVKARHSNGERRELCLEHLFYCLKYQHSVPDYFSKTNDKTLLNQYFPSSKCMYSSFFFPFLFWMLHCGSWKKYYVKMLAPLTHSNKQSISAVNAEMPTTSTQQYALYTC